jgi:hypothetical protein
VGGCCGNLNEIAFIRTPERVFTYQRVRRFAAAEACTLQALS